MRALGAPFRVAGLLIRFLLDLTPAQLRTLFALTMIGGMVALSVQNVALSFFAKNAIERGDTYLPFFDLIQEQMRFNSALVAWFAIIMGLIVFGADYFRAKHGESELGFGKGQRPDAQASAQRAYEEPEHVLRPTE